MIDMDRLVEMIVNANDLNDLQERLRDATTVVDDRPHLEAAQRILDYLNKQAARQHRSTTKIENRLRDGFTESMMMKIIDHKVEQWAGKKDCETYLRPSTLFGSKNKVDKYSEEVQYKEDFLKREQQAKQTNKVRVIPGWSE